MDNIKNFFKKIFKLNKELTREEEQELVGKIFRKIKEADLS